MKPNTQAVRRICPLLAAAACTLVAVMAAAAQGSAIARPEPLALALQPAAQATAVLLLENVTDLYGLEAHLTFDPNVVEVVDADAAKPGAQLLVADWLKNGFVATNQADNATGKIDFAATLINPAPPFSGSGHFATITFAAKQNGVSPLALDSALFVTRDADVIAVALQKGSIGVSADGTFPAPDRAAGAAAIILPGAAGGSLLPIVTLLSVFSFLGALAVLVYALVTTS
jgi:hypothetical protein